MATHRRSQRELGSAAVSCEIESGDLGGRLALPSDGFDIGRWRDSECEFGCARPALASSARLGSA